MTSEANGGLAAPEAAALKEVAPANGKVEKALVQLSTMPDRGIGAFGTPVEGGGKGRSANRGVDFVRGPLLRPIS